MAGMADTTFAPKHVPRKWLLRAVLVVVFTSGALAAVEVVARMIDGYRLTSLRLDLSRSRLSPAETERRAESKKWWGAADAWPYVEKLPTAAGVDRNWFQAKPPERTPAPPDGDLEARARRYDRIPLEANYEWNRGAVAHAVCRGYDGYEGTFNQLDDMYVFDPIDGSEFPTFRFLRSASYPSGLRTNAFGWRGADIAVTKPPQTVRIAFVGASTTVGFHAEPYSYPEVAGLWLQRWADVRHPGLRVETINAGREAVNSRSIQAIVRQELVPVEPDLVVYYEGANQFWPADYIWTPLPRRVSGKAYSVLSAYSALGRRLESAMTLLRGPGSEPFKPGIKVNWPPALNEQDPDLAYPDLPIQLPRILSDVDTIRRALDAEGSALVMTSFEWLVHPGMMLDPQRDAVLFAYLNTKYFPFSYAHMRRFLDFQNRVFRKYAASHGLDFIDFAAQYPQDPRLFDDAIHMTRAGVRMQAWIMFNGLVPIIERRLASGEWPRPARHRLPSHPAFGERQLVLLKAIRAGCGAAAN
jgi:hypothetical protein